MVRLTAEGDPRTPTSKSGRRIWGSHMIAQLLQPIVSAHCAVLGLVRPNYEFAL